MAFKVTQADLEQKSNRLNCNNLSTCENITGLQECRNGKSKQIFNSKVYELETNKNKNFEVHSTF